MGTKFNQIIPAHDVEDQPAGEVATWFNSVTDCFIMTQADSVGEVEQISIYPPQMRELRDLLNKALGETPVQYKTGPLTMDKVFQQANITNLSDIQAVLDRVEVVLGQETLENDCHGDVIRYEREANEKLRKDKEQIEQELIDKIMEQAGAYGQQYKVGSPGWHKWKSTLMFLSVYKSPAKEPQDD